jgi:hypothetical protein
VTVIEVALIVSVMLAGKAGSETLARDAAFAAVVLILQRPCRPLSVNWRRTSPRARVSGEGRERGARGAGDAFGQASRADAP